MVTSCILICGWACNWFLCVCSLQSQYEKHKEVSTSQGVKILGKDLEKTLAGLPLLVAHKEDEIPVLRVSHCLGQQQPLWGQRWLTFPGLQDELVRELKQTLSSIKLEEKGVYVQASTLGSLEALLEFLRTSKVPVSARLSAYTRLLLRLSLWLFRHWYVPAVRWY